MGTTRGGGGLAGCLAAGARLAALAVIGPFVAAGRWLRRRRRGETVRWRLDRARVEGRGGPLERLDLRLDLPVARELEATRALVAAMARCAELLRCPGDVYHLVQRPPWEEETELLAVGPQVQELAERLALRWRRPELEGTTGVWIVLPGERWLGHAVPPGYDPEGEGGPEELLLGTDCRWGFAEAMVRDPASVRYRLVVYVAPEGAARVEERLERTARRLAAPRRV